MSNYTKENLIAVSSTEVPTGTLAIKVGDEVFTAGNVTIGVDTSDATVTAEKLLEGVTAYGTNGEVTGTIQTVTATLNNNVTTVPKGYIAESQTLTVPEAAAPTTSGNVVTIRKGYQASQKEITVGTSKAAATITPGTSDIIIAKGTYLSGNQTIKGDANLTADNIKEGVSIFGVSGSLSSTPTESISYVVSGGGSTAYNGVYVDRNVEVAGKPSYVNDNGKYLCYTEDYGWIIGDYLNADDPMCYCNMSSDITNGYMIEAGDEPSPVVSKYDPYANLVAENIKSGVIINNITGTFTSDADASAADIAAGKTAYVNGEKITGISEGGGGGETSFLYPFKGSLSGDAIASYIPIQGKRIHEWDVGMSEPDSWGGNFEQSTLLGQDRQVLSFPVQSEDDYPDGKYCHWCDINVAIAKIVLQEAWSISCCFRFGDVWNTYSNLVVFGSSKNGGYLFGVKRDVRDGVWVTVNNVGTNKRAVTVGKWYYCKVEKRNNTVYCYLVDDPTESKITALNESSPYMMGTLPAPTTISDEYANDVLFFGYNNTSDYRVFQLADVKITAD